MHTKHAMDEADDLLMARWKEQSQIMNNSYVLFCFV